MERTSAFAARYGALIGGVVLLLALYVSSLHSYLLFHSLAELFSVVVACGIFIVAWNSRRFLDNHYLLFIGIAYLFVAALDTVHTLGYKGMGVFQGYSTNLATQLWIAARYMESLSLLAAPFFIRRKLNAWAVFLVYAVAISGVLASIFWWPVFPVCFVDGAGLTLFKKVSEYVISLFLVGAGALLVKSRKEFDPGVLRLLIASVVVTVGSELAFTLYSDPYGFLNLVGHYLKIVSFYLIYKALIETGLSRPYDLLFRELKQREESLAHANAELEAVNKELEAFSYSASHDLKAPLRTIDGFSHLVQKDYSDKLDDRGRDYLNQVRGAAKDMGRLIEDLLVFARAAHNEMKNVPVDLSAIAANVAGELQAAQPERKVEFVVGQGAAVTGDPALLKVVMVNLMANAWKFTGKRPDARIEFGITENSGKWVYFVRDNGVGFDMNYAAKLFLPFERLHSASEFPGTGIGLATVQRIIKRHGGKVWAEGTVGQGATFYFRL